MILYHGTDLDSALDILNHGLDANNLGALQAERPTQLGSGWYTAMEPETAWFFASFAPGNQGRGFTVIELEVPDAMVKQFIASGQAIMTEISSVPFVARQLWFAVSTFALVNSEGVFRPCKNKDGFNG